MRDELTICTRKFVAQVICMYFILFIDSLPSTVLPLFPQTAVKIHKNNLHEVMAQYGIEYFLIPGGGVKNVM